MAIVSRVSETCGSSDLNSANPDFAVSRTLMVEAYDGGAP